MSETRNETLATGHADPSGARVIRAAAEGEGVLLNDRHFRLEDIDELVEELTRQSEGRLAELRVAAREVEARLRQQAEDSRERIQKAMAVARERIDQQLRATAQRSREILDRRHREGYEEGRDEGYRRGYEEGLQRGLEAGLLEGRSCGREAARRETIEALEEELAPLRASLRALSGQLDRDWRTHFQEARRELIELALEAARAITREHIESCPDAIGRTLEGVLERLGARHQVVVELHPEDRAAAARFLEGRGARLLDGAAFSLVDEPEVGRGGCRVRAGETEIDATIEGQFAVLRERLQGVGQDA